MVSKIVVVLVADFLVTNVTITSRNDKENNSTVQLGGTGVKLLLIL